MHKPKLWLAGALLALVCASCLGANHATGHMFKWNGEIENRWGRSVVFVVTLPVYAIFGIGDLLIFNSIQWWSGTNPISSPGNAGQGSAIRVGTEIPLEPVPEKTTR